MTSIPASRRARAMIFAPRSCPSRPGFATSTRIFLSDIEYSAGVLFFSHHCLKKEEASACVTEDYAALWLPALLNVIVNLINQLINGILADDCVLHLPRP